MVGIDDLSFSYGKKKLFSGLSLEMRAGNIYGLLGKNGAGKTTLLKIISGLLFPDGGSCRTLGERPGRRLPEMLSDIFYLPEELYLPAVRPHSYLRLYAPFYPHFDVSLFERFIHEFELSLDEKITSYSYGQKKKFLLAFGLATQAALVLLDEPTNGLDIPSKSQFRRIVASALTEERTFLISTHQVRDMEHLIDPIIIIEDGRIIFNRPLHEISSRIAITFESREPDPEDVLYAEKVLGGYSVVRAGTGEREIAVDLETLFNVVTSAKDRIDGLLDEAPKGGNQ